MAKTNSNAARLVTLIGGTLLSANFAKAEILWEQNPITAVEFQQRLRVCLATEDWLKAACLEVLAGLDISAASPVPISDAVVEPDADEPPPDSELHMIGIYESRPVRMDDGQVRRGEVPVHVDRPGATVSLALSSNEAVKWTVTATPRTMIDRVIVSNRHRNASEVALNGEAVQIDRADNIGYAYRGEGPRFLNFYDNMLELTGNDRAASFHGDYRAPADGYSISEAPGVATRQELVSRLLERARDRSTLPRSMQDILNGDLRTVAQNWRFDETGFVGIDATGTAVAFRMPPDLPRVSGVGNVAYDPDGQRLWAVTYSGEGFLYEYDIRNDRWSARSMNRKDAAGLIYDQVANRLVGTPGTLPGSPYFVFNNGSTLLSTPQVSPRDYPGLVQTFDAGNGPSPGMVPLAIEGDLILVRPTYALRRPDQTIPSLIYLVDIGTGAVELIR